MHGPGSPPCPPHTRARMLIAQTEGGRGRCRTSPSCPCNDPISTNSTSTTGPGERRSPGQRPRFRGAQQGSVDTEVNSSKAVRHGAPRKCTVAWGADPKLGGCLGFGRPGSRPEVPATPFRGFRPFVRPSHGTRERLCSPDSHCEVVRVGSQRKRLVGRSGSEQRSVRCRDARGQTRGHTCTVWFPSPTALHTPSVVSPEASLHRTID